MGLVQGAVFFPYVATVLFRDPAQGQTFVSTISLAASLAVAVLAPILGSSIDQLGHRKPLLLLLTIMMVPLMAALWFAAPSGGLPLLTLAALLVAIHVLLVAGEIVFSSMLPFAAAPGARSAASGLALSLGNVVTFVQLALLLWAFSPVGPAASAGAHAQERFVPVLVAATFAVGALPLFLASRDAPARDAWAGLATVRLGLADLKESLKGGQIDRDVGAYVVSRVLTQDAGMVILALSGVLAAGVMGWGVREMMLLGLLQTVAGMGAGILANALDQRLGSRVALQVEIIGSLAALVLLLGTTPETIAFQPISEGATFPLLSPFDRPPEAAYLGFSLLVALFQIATWSSARSLLAELAPPDRIGSVFGLSALATSATGWIGPMLVGLLTAMTGRQQAGFMPCAVMLLAGAILLGRVRGGGAARG